MRYVLAALLVCAMATSFGVVATAAADPLDDLALDFWAWRVTTQPSSGDDIPRIERPDGWLPDWSPAAVVRRRVALDGFERRYRAIDPAGWPVPRQVDHRLVGAALARVRWELDGAPAWRRDPSFYIQQALGPVFDVLLPPPPVSAARADSVISRLAQAARTLEHARTNLDDVRAPFARLAVDTLTDIDQRLATLARELDAAVPSRAGQFQAPATAAGGALGAFRVWLEGRLPSMPADTAVGRDAYTRFLREVALVPFTPDELLAMGRQEWERAVAFETLEQGRNRALPPMPLFPDQAAQIAASAAQEQAIRVFLERERLLTVPAWMQHYLNLPLPAYLAPLSFIGVTDDLTSSTRLTENGISYIREPSPALPYFYLSIARDPRPIIVHEGVPGHYMQLALAWAHENPIRRQYYDSGAQEGIGFYAEEMMLQAGCWPTARDRARSSTTSPACARCASRSTCGSRPARSRSSRPPTTSRRRCRWITTRRSKRRRASPPAPARRSPTRSASCRSSGCSPTRAGRRATPSRCAPSTTWCGRTATSRSRCCGGSCSAIAARSIASRPSTDRVKRLR